ncbi:hypothetical protein Hypma_003454 [Hypsizygus marmoreus]|uniref:Uncharacterized protein n=1 Tax=Hypsizygus marmoreus TaxID=39966 RepID=A0A369J3U9_HYPMA|nr:hypothetical protein Hypma_003454 [Hypsizygus marmoreus]
MSPLPSPTTARHTYQTINSYSSDATAVSADELGKIDNVLIDATQHAETSRNTNASPQGSSHRGILPLPKGAMAMPMAMSYDSDRHLRDREDSPPSTPSQRLLEAEQPSHVQFASYRDDKTPPLLLPLNSGSASPRTRSAPLEKGWVPWPLRPWFWIPFVLILAAGAVGLEIALHFSKKNQGWPTKRDIGDETSVLHYVYTLPPVAVAAILVAMWTWTDIEIKKMQPYVDLVHGDSPPHRSLLLDYTRTNNFIVWTSAASNKHYLVALASLMVVLSLAFQPLAAALLVVKDTWWQEPDVTLSTLGALGLNQNLQFNELTSFLTAAGYASAAVLYRLADPSFINGPYTVAPFQLPTNLASNGTVFANTTALKSDTGCQPASVDMVQNADGNGWTNTARHNDCIKTFAVDKNTTTLFGTDTGDCSSALPPQFSPVIFWFFTYQPSARASATFCYPSFTLWDVNVNVDLASGNLTKVTELRPFSSSSNFSSLSANITGAPLFSRAYNGIKFNLTNPDVFVLARQAATQLQLPAAVYQSAVQSSQGLVGSFEANRFVELSTDVYQRYLALIAKTVYFLPSSEPITVQVKTIKKRVWLGDTAVHLLAAAMLLLAFFGTIVHLFHRADRRNLRLRHEPGTIASAVSIGAQTDMGNLLAGRQNAKEMTAALQNKKFRIDPHTMKIVMEGEVGYESAASPTEGKKSIFTALQGQGLTRRFSKPPSMPNTPRPTNDAV